MTGNTRREGVRNGLKRDSSCLDKSSKLFNMPDLSWTWTLGAGTLWAAATVAKVEEGATGGGDVLEDADFQCFIKLGKTCVKLDLAGITRNGVGEAPEATGLINVSKNLSVLGVINGDVNDSEGTGDVVTDDVAGRGLRM